MLLLDTHIMLWYIAADAKLPDAMKTAIETEKDTVSLSVASSWEVLIKHQLGKLPLPASPIAFLKEQCDKHRIQWIDIELDAMEKLATLPMLHRDPFDRIIMAQSMQYHCQLMTVDPIFLKYPGIRIWES